MKQNFKIVSLLTIFTIVLNVLSFVVMTPAKAATNVSDTMSTMNAGALAVTHTIHTTGDATFTVPTDFANVTVVTCTDNGAVTGGESLTCSNGQTFTADNPVVGGYDFGLFDIAIVDSDTVNVTGYINTSITFDLDTGTLMGTIPSGTNSTSQMIDDCAATVCQGYSAQGDPTTRGASATNYTVDLGNLVAGSVIASGAADQLHANGGTGDVNYIGFDLASNAAHGTAITVSSAHGALTRAGGDPDAWDIPSSSLTSPINLATMASAHQNGYGIKFFSAPDYINLGSLGVITQMAGCTNTDTTYCTVTKGVQTLMTTADSVQGLRGTLMVGALANGTNPAGTYADTLTFIATSTF